MFVGPSNVGLTYFLDPNKHGSGTFARLKALGLGWRQVMCGRGGQQNPK